MPDTYAPAYPRCDDHPIEAGQQPSRRNMDATQERAAEPEQTNRAQQEWWEAWLPGLLLAQAAGLVAMFYLPVYPDLAVPVAAWQVACAVALGFLLWRARVLLGPATVVEVMHKPDGSLKAVRRYSMPQLALAFAAVMGVLSAFYALNFTTPLPLLYQSPFSFALFASISLACTGAFVLSWLEYRGASVRERLLGLRGSLGVLAIVAGVAYLAFGLFPTFARSVIFQGAPAPWSKVYALARHEADKRLKNANLSDVLADMRPKYDGTYNAQTPLYVYFQFDSAEGSQLSVAVLDSDPPRLLSVTNYGVQTIEGYFPEVAKRLAAMKLGPRDIYRLTEQEGMQFAREEGYKAQPDFVTTLNPQMLYIEQLNGRKLLVPWGWEVDYESFGDGALVSLHLIVDPDTGAVLRRERFSPGGVEETCSPCSTPVPQLTTGPTTTP
jgi:hypothetical protein